ncbi:MAG: bifunctional 3'-5' exonuclease/DNA polymerase, partial [Streptomycetaceae bacterium]|nr:bifunctional 3'-5' exonuclease/DNA polymerase [Streptomycetaceae bacterium]
IQASAADWALVLLAVLRGRLTALAESGPGRPHLVFFQHDEVIVHAPRVMADAVVAAVEAAADEAKQLVFGDVPVRLPVVPAVVDDYASAK